MKHWLVRDGAGYLRIEVVFLPQDARDDASLQAIDSLLWRGLSARDPEVRHILEPIYFALQRLPVPSSAPRAVHFERVLADALRTAARSGRLRIVRDERENHGGGGAVARVEPPVAAPTRKREVIDEPDTWIAIELVDEDGEPVPNVPYRIETPDGRVLTGLTNDRGRARQDGIYAGNCKVTFPELHAPDWKKTG